MIITFDTEKMSEKDFTMLVAILTQPPTTSLTTHFAAGGPPAGVAVRVQSSEEPAPEPEAPAEEPPTDGPTMADAVAVATKLVSEGKAADVKKALGAVGAKRVSELAEKDIPAFLDSLK